MKIITTTESAATRVARGARFLDEVAPGWEARINTQTLAMASGMNCICGQVFAEKARWTEHDGFGYARDLFYEGAAWVQALAGVQPYQYLRLAAIATALGFYVQCPGPVGGHDDACAYGCKDYEPLHDAWVALLKERAELGVL